MANEVVERIRAIARRRRVPKSEEKAAYATGRVEANFTNPGGGDADSAGWRQERASLYKDPTNLDASINRFFDEAAKLDHGQKSGELAADVQRPRSDLRGKYSSPDVQREAQALLRGGSSGAQKEKTPSAPSSPTTGGGQDAREARRAALQQYLATEHTDPNALINLAAGVKAAKAMPDAPATTARAGLSNRRQGAKASSGGSGAVDFAVQRIGGYAESAAPNRGPKLDALEQRFGLTGEPWCAMFATTAASHGGASREVRTASVADINQWAREGSHGYSKGLLSPAKARAGDLITFGDDHVGVVHSVDKKAGTVTTIEGNTSDGKVQRVTRPLSEGQIARPAY